MQSATTSDGGRTWTNADKPYRKAGNESVQIPRGIYAIQSARVDLVSEDSVDSGLAPDLSCGAGDPLVVEGAGDVQIPLPTSAIPKMRSTTAEVAASGSRVGRFLAPSCTMSLR